MNARVLSISPYLIQSHSSMKNARVCDWGLQPHGPVASGINNSIKFVLLSIVAF